MHLLTFINIKYYIVTLKTITSLVDKSDQAKIIDFGFGKKIQFDDFDRSISLATTCPPPEEFKSKNMIIQLKSILLGNYLSNFLNQTLIILSLFRNTF